MFYTQLYSILLIVETVVIQELDLAIDGDTRPSCLISGSSATLTCITTGYPGPNLPRPTIIFRKGNIEIVAGMPGFERITRPYFDQVIWTEYYRCVNNSMQVFV